LRPPLKILHVIAKMTVDKRPSDRVDRTRGKMPRVNKSSREKIGHLADGLIGDTKKEPAYQNHDDFLLSEPNEKLIKQGVESPVSAFKFASIEVAEETVVYKSRL